MHRKLAEDLKQLLRRIEEMPNPAPANPVAPNARWLGIGAQPGTAALALPLARPAGSISPWHGKLAALLLFGVVAIAATAAVFSSPQPNEPAGDAPPVDRPGNALVAPPARDDETPPVTVGDAAPAAVTVAPAGAQAERTEEAREQTTPLPEGLRRSLAVPVAGSAPKPTLMVPTIHATSGQHVRVAMRIEPATFSTKAFEVTVHGLPRGARFIQGRSVAPDRWVIPASALGKLELALGDAAAGRFELVAELHSVSGGPVVQTRSALVVTPPGHSQAPSARSRQPVGFAPSGRVLTAAKCRPCRCFRASRIYWEYRGAGTWVARAGLPATTCYATTSIN